MIYLTFEYHCVLYKLYKKIFNLIKLYIIDIIYYSNKKISNNNKIMNEYIFKTK